MCLACELRELSDDQLAALASEVDQTLFTVLKIDSLRSRTLATEEQLSKGTTKAWKQSADAALTASLPKVGASQSKVNAFLRSMAIKMKKPLTADQKKWIRQRIDKIYKTAKRVSAKAANAKVSFKLVDKGAVKAIGEHQVFWIGDFYSEHLSARIRGVSEEIMLKSGLSNREAGKALRTALRREFGITPGGKTTLAPQIPARFAGNPDLYFRGVASTAGHQSRTFGSMRAFSEAGIRRYKIINPSDERTGQICQRMVDQVFEVQIGVQNMDRQLAAKNPKEIRDEIAPWHGPKALDKIIGKAKRGSDLASQRLADAGSSLPPYHPLCRSEAVIISG
jgi:hypothetical protein